jgi:MFS family permease
MMQAQTANIGSQKVISAHYAWYALGLLTVVYLLNFLDRMLIYILFTPIKSEMKFSDVELALLSSTSFIIFYTILGIPFGRLADRISRKTLIAIGLASWSIFSGLTGFAVDFWTIFLCRVGVGIGEATLGPAALSLLSDYFPRERRATVQGIYSSAIALGSGLAFLLGGAIAQAIGWRYAFYFLGFPGVLVALLVAALIEPERGQSEIKTQHASQPQVPPSWHTLYQNAKIWFHHGGYALFNVASASVAAWLTVFFVRVHQLSLVEVGTWFGLAMIVGGIIGIVGGGYLADRFRETATGGRMKLASLSAAASACCWALMLFSNNLPLLLALNFLLIGFSLSWLGPSFADLNDIAAPNMRGLAVGIYFFLVNLAGYGLAPLLIGALNDYWNVSTHPEVMRLSLLVCPVACVLATIVLGIGSRNMNNS